MNLDHQPIDAFTDPDVFWPELQTPLVRLTYDVRTRTGVLYLPPISCTDTTGAIERFTRLDPYVRCIRTVAGDEEDTRYDRLPSGQWVATLPAWMTNRASGTSIHVTHEGSR